MIKTCRILPNLVVLALVVSVGTACASGSRSGASQPTATVASLATPALECTPPLCQSGEVFSCSNGICSGGCGTICATVTPGFVTATPMILCTQPACPAGEVLSCPQGDCTGSCTVTCVQPTAVAKNATAQSSAQVDLSLPSTGISKDNASQMVTLGKISDGPVNELAFSSDSNNIAVSTGNSAIVHDMTSLQQVISQQYNLPTSSVAFPSSDNQIAVADGNAIWLVPLDGSDPVQLDSNLDPSVKITHLDYSPDDTMLAYASSNGAINLFDLNQMSAQASPVATPGVVNSLQYSPDSSFLAAGTEDGKLVVLDTTNWSEVKRVEGLGSVKGVAFSADATSLAVATKNNVMVWETNNWNQKFSVPISGDTALSVAYSGDENLLAVGTSTGIIHILDANNGQEITKLTGHRAPVTAVAFSGDGLFLASGSSDGTIRLWGVQ